MDSYGTVAGFVGSPPPRLQRKVAISSGIVTKAVPLSSTRAFVGEGGLALPVVDPTQGIRIADAFFQVSDAANSSHLSLDEVNAGLWFTGSGGNDQLQLRAWPYEGTGGGLGVAPNIQFLGQAGIRWRGYTPDIIRGRDYVELAFSGITPGAFNLEILTSVNNNDGAAAHNLTFIILALCEIYQFPIED